MLQKEINEDLLDALFLPTAQGNPQVPTVLRSRRGFTTLEPLVVTAADLKRLRDFAQDGVYNSAKLFRAALLTGRAADIANTRATIDNTIARLSPAKQDEAKYLVGNMISEIAPNDEYVHYYRSAVEERVAKDLANQQDVQPLKLGHPFAVGSGEVMLRDLRTVNPDQVKAFLVRGKTYAKTWLGRNLIVVAQDSSKPVVKGPTGLDSLHLADNVSIMVLGKTALANQTIPNLHPPLQ